MYQLAVPVFHVKSSERAEAFYCRKLGYELKFAFRLDEASEDPCYMGLTLGDVWLHVSSFPGDAVAGGVAVIMVNGVDALHTELVEQGVSIDLKPTDQTWGNREMYVKDEDGNTLRFTQSIS